MSPPESPPAHYEMPLLHTPFHRRARALSQADQFIAWAGYTTVDVFTSAEHEYFAIRNACSVYDLSPLVKYRISGPEAEAFLNRLVTRDVASLRNNRVSYTIWCNDEGKVIEDGTLFRFGPTEFRLCAADRQLDWLLDSAIGFDVEIADVTDQVAALSVQGPTSAAVLKAAGLSGIERLRPFDLAGFDLAGASIRASRTGFTGDLGYELWMTPADSEQVWDMLMLAGQSRGIRAIGSRALDMARMEAGFMMLDADFISAEGTVRTGTAASPFELGLAPLLDFRKGHFNGRRALLKENPRVPKRLLVGLDIAGNKPAHDALLYADKAARKPIGAVTSAMWSPTCKRNIALAFIDAPYHQTGSDVWADVYFCRELQWERRLCRATVVDRRFFSPERRRLTPPADR